MVNVNEMNVYEMNEVKVTRPICNNGFNENHRFLLCLAQELKNLHILVYLMVNIS